MIAMNTLTKDNFQVHIDMKLCELHGQCVYLVPEVFQLTQDSLVYQAEVPAELREKVEKAVRACPQLAIKIVD